MPHQGRIPEGLKDAPLAIPGGIQRDHFDDMPPWGHTGVILAGEGAPDAAHDSVQVHPHLMLPETADLPSSGLEGFGLSPVARHVLLKLPGPESGSTPGPHVMVWAAVPEAPIHEYGHLGAGKREIRLPAGGWVLEAVPEALGPETAAQTQLGPGVGSADPSHQP
jgi:hypothetical protein